MRFSIHDADVPLPQGRSLAVPCNNRHIEFHIRHATPMNGRVRHANAMQPWLKCLCPEWHMKTLAGVAVGALLLAVAGAFAAGNGGPPSQFPGNGNGPPNGWFPGGGGGLGSSGGFPGEDGGFVPTAGPAIGPSTVNTVPEPSTILLSIAALAVLAGLSRRR